MIFDLSLLTLNFQRNQILALIRSIESDRMPRVEHSIGQNDVGRVEIVVATVVCLK